MQLVEAQKEQGSLHLAPGQGLFVTAIQSLLAGLASSRGKECLSVTPKLALLKAKIVDAIQSSQTDQDQHDQVATGALFPRQTDGV